jgi:hypothetical protein
MITWKRLAVIAFVLALVAAAGGYIASKAYPPKFRARPLLQLSAHAPRILFRAAENDAEDDYKRYKKTQVTLVKSRLVLNTALQDTTVSAYQVIREQADPVAWLHDNLEVDFIGDSEVMEIALRGDDSNEVAGLVNAVMKGYVDEVVNVDAKRRADRHAKLKQIKDTYTEILKERRDRLRKLSEISIAGARVGPNGIERSELLNLYRDLWTKRVDLQLERVEAEGKLARRKNAAAESVVKEIEQIQEQLATLIAQEKVIDERLSQMADNMGKLANQSLDRESLKSEIATLEDTGRKVSDEVQALNVELRAPPRVRIIEDATPPSTRSRGSLWGRLTSR